LWKKSYAYCISAEGKAAVCAPESNTLCVNELDSACLKKSKGEALANFKSSNIEAQLVNDYRRIIFHNDLERVMNQMEQISRQEP
jgi:uncharacterized protein YceH (UPF0502 family)